VKLRTLLALFFVALVGSAGCGKISPKTTDAGSHPDTAARTDAQGDRGEDALHEDAHHDAPMSHDAVMSDARADHGALDATSPPHDASSDGTLTGGACGADTDCVLYPAGTGGCCGACLPKSQPTPGTVQCLLPCLTPLKGCTCVKAACTGSTTLL